MKQNLEEGSNKKRKIEEKNGDVPTNEDGGVVPMDVEQPRPSQMMSSQKGKSTSRI
ncbi:hypothetical protein A2U01_0112059, partial [Trifolium medium]|nr:hypothetical protein [Trifolium medium]